MGDAGNLISDIVAITDAADNVRCESGSGELCQRDNSKTPSNPGASMEKERSEALSPRALQANGRKSRAEDARGKNGRSKLAKETRRSNGSSSGRSGDSRFFVSLFFFHRNEIPR